VEEVAFVVVAFVPQVDRIFDVPAPDTISKHPRDFALRPDSNKQFK
jgi:hypothetical protein